MGLSATKFFKHWPEMSAEFDEISLHNAWIETFKHSGEQMIAPLLVSDRLRDAGLDPDTPPGTFQMRPLVYKMFVNQVERLGVEVQFGKRVVDYFEDVEKGRAGVVTDQGGRYEADIVIAADGKRAHKLNAAPETQAGSETDLYPNPRCRLQESEAGRGPSPGHEFRTRHVACRLPPGAHPKTPRSA